MLIGSFSWLLRWRGSPAAVLDTYICPCPGWASCFSPDLYRLLLVAWGALGTADARVCCLSVRQWSACRRAGRCAWAVLLRVLIPRICARWRRGRRCYFYEKSSSTSFFMGRHGGGDRKSVV